MRAIDRPKIKIGQIWREKSNRMQVLISQKKGDRWKAKVLTPEHDVFGGTHTFQSSTLWWKFELI